MIRANEIETRPPVDGESLDGLLAAITASNFLLRISRLRDPGSVDHGHRTRLATSSWDELPDLADLLGVDVEDLRHRAHPQCDGARRRFFGSTVSVADLNTRVRRFSPGALAEAPYHRALWQLRLPFDVETGEMLQDSCWDCGAVQGWKRSFGVDRCDICEADLTLVPTTLVPPDTLGDLRLAIGLIDPDPAVRSASMALVPERLRADDSGHVLELVFRLATVVHRDCTWSRTARYWKNDPSVLAEAIACAWRVLPDMTRGVRTAISAALATNEKRFGDGNGGDSLRFLRLRNELHSIPIIWQAAATIHDAMSLVGPNGGVLRSETAGVNEVARMTGVSEAPLSDIRRGGGLRTVAVMRDSVIVANFDRSEVEQVAIDIRRRQDLNGGTDKLGIPLYGLERIVEAGDLDILDHPYFGLRYPAVQTTKAAIGNLAARIEWKAKERLACTTPLAIALHAVSGGLKPWGTLVRAMLDGRLPLRLDPGPEPLMRRVSIRRADLLKVLADPPPPRRTTIAIAKAMTKRDAGEVLNLAPREGTKLFRGVHNYPRMAISIDHVEQLARDFISTVEIAARSGRSVRQVVQAASDNGLKRHSPAGYPRLAAETLLIPPGC